jgi:hypothetical protein
MAVSFWGLTGLLLTRMKIATELNSLKLRIIFGRLLTFALNFIHLKLLLDRYCLPGIHYEQVNNISIVYQLIWSRNYSKKKVRNCFHR